MKPPLKKMKVNVLTLKLRRRGLHYSTMHGWYVVTMHGWYVVTMHGWYVVTMHGWYVATMHGCYVVTMHGWYAIERTKQRHAIIKYKNVHQNRKNSTARKTNTSV